MMGGKIAVQDWSDELGEGNLRIICRRVAD
jgi:hypothetical protein